MPYLGVLEKSFSVLEKSWKSPGNLFLKKGTNPVVTSDEKILIECVSFYKNLFSSKSTTYDQNDTTFFPEREDESTIHEQELTVYEGALTERECLEALNDMGTEKTPGTDSLPAEFYKVFWKDISAILIRALNYAYETGQLSATQRRGIIKLIPKQDAEPFFIKNWRPLTLLNCDYKIAAKSIANRLKPSLPNLINNDQTGFIKGRFIGENIRLIDSVICYAKEKKYSRFTLVFGF